MKDEPPAFPLLQKYKRLIDISRDLASTLDLSALLKRIVEAARDLSNSAAASILLYDGNTNQLFFQATTNLAEDSPASGMNVPVEGSIAGWAVLKRKIVKVADVHQDPHFFGNVEKAVNFPTSSLMAIPLITREKVVGVLEVLNKHDGEYTGEDEELMSVLGAHAAVAIENSHLFMQSDLISELVHELRTPLASINTASHLIERPELSDEQRQELITAIQTETKRLNEMASSYLDLAQLESGRVAYQSSRFSLAELAESCRNLLKERIDEKQVSFAIRLPADLPQVRGDRDKIKQVLLNLFSNAVKYNQPGGAVTVSAALREKEVSLSVQDTGIGIPPDAMPHLFERFFRTRDAERIAHGTGLGLSICKRIIEAHHGRIEVESKLGRGSTFTLYFPL